MTGVWRLLPCGSTKAKSLRTSWSTFGKAEGNSATGASGAPKTLRQCASFGRHVNEDSKDGLLYREAYTTYAAEEVLERLVKGCGLRPERTAVPQPGRIVFVYRPRESMNIEGSGQWAEGSRRRKGSGTLFFRSLHGLSPGVNTRSGWRKGT